jgi:hypothetical protein
MKTTKEQLIAFLENNILTPVENHNLATDVIKKKVRATRMRLNNLQSAEKVEEFFWHAMASDKGIDSYTKIKAIGGSTFEDVWSEFKTLGGRTISEGCCHEMEFLFCSHRGGRMRYLLQDLNK